MSVNIHIGETAAHREMGDGGWTQGCPVSKVRSMLRHAGLRPTRQRIALGWLMFGKGHRHISAETLFEEANRAGAKLSLATVYNTLHQFTEANLLRELAMDGAKTYFDTNVDDHHHFFVEGENGVIDIEHAPLHVDGLPDAPAGYEIVRCDVVIRLRRKT